MRPAVNGGVIYFYLDEISGWRFEQEMRESGLSEREYLSRYFAARIPGDFVGGFLNRNEQCDRILPHGIRGMPVSIQISIIIMPDSAVSFRCCWPVPKDSGLYTAENAPLRSAYQQV